MRRIGIAGRVLTTAVAILIGTVAAACGGGGEDTPLEEYFRRWEVFIEEAREEEEAENAMLAAQLDDAETEEESFDVIKDAFDRSEASAAEHTSPLWELVPPPEAQVEHDLYLEARSEHQSFRESRMQPPSAFDSLTEYGDFLTDLLSDPQSIRLSVAEFDACLTLQAVAHGEGIEVDLGCILIGPRSTE